MGGVIALVTLLALALFFIMKARNKGSPEFSAFSSAVMDAANVGGGAYIAQVESVSRSLGKKVEVSHRGLALARLLCALFPTASFVVLDAGDGLKSATKKAAPFSGKETWAFASGAALESMGIDPDHPDYSSIKNDTNVATRAFAEYFGSTFTGDPMSDLPSARQYLAPYWQTALELSLGETDVGAYSDQFCTSGLHTFVDWLGALSR